MSFRTSQAIAGTRLWAREDKKKGKISSKANMAAQRAVSDLALLVMLSHTSRPSCMHSHAAAHPPIHTGQ